MPSKYFPHFQPIIDVGKKSIIGYEALARTCGGDGSVQSLGALFSDPNYDRDALLLIDRSVRLQAMQRLAASEHPFYLSLNMSPEWMNHVEEHQPVPSITMAQSSGMPCERILIEFVESAGDNAKMQSLLRRYREAGMRIAIDDFGAGHSHIDRVVALRPDVIKMDMAFFKRGMAGGVSQDVVRSIGSLARRTGSELLCEGVETKEEFYFALDCGARYVQGYFFARPAADLLSPDAPAEQLAALMQDYLADKMQAAQTRHNYLQQMDDFFCQVQDALAEAVVNLSELPAAPTGFLRAYLCHRNGDQISPNFECSDSEDGQWRASMANQGVNWAMRRYFHQILAAGQLQQRRKALSSPYRDMRNGQLCQTLGLLLEDDRILLADIACHDDIGVELDGDDLYLR